MKFVADANILFALAKPSSVANTIVKKHGLRLLAPDFALIELYKHKRELVVKSEARSFSDIITLLQEKVVFVDAHTYRSQLPKATALTSDKDDAAYLALALTFFLPVWSNDSHLKEQDDVPVFTTKELIESLGSFESV